MYLDVSGNHAQRLEEGASSGLIISITNVVFFLATLGIRACRGNDCDFRTVSSVPYLAAIGPNRFPNDLDEFLVGWVVVVEEDAAEEEELDRGSCHKQQSTQEDQLHLILFTTIESTTHPYNSSTTNRCNLHSNLPPFLPRLSFQLLPFSPYCPILSIRALKIYLRILIYNIKMSLLGTNQVNDDYKNDFKPDASVPAFTDSFSSISWAPSIPQVFASTAWNGELRVFEVASTGYGNAIVQKMSFSFQQPALKCCWNDQSTQIYVGLMDGTIKLFDINSGQAADVGRHSAAISSLHFVPGMNTVVSSAYESNIQFWQPGNPNPVMTFNAENKVFTSDFMFPMLVAGTANEKIMIVDINNAGSRTITDSNDLGKFSQIQSIALNQKCTMFGIASYDGRANLSQTSKNVNGMYTAKSVITFKSNKQEENGNTILYPINSVSFNPINDRWFMTAGSDGGMHFWDYEAKNKIKSLNYGGIPICTAKVSPNGTMVAYGLGNDWHLGAEGSKWQPKLGVHPIAENQTKFAK